MWLGSVNIAVHDFTVTNAHSPSQLAITSFFQQVSQAPQPQTTDINKQITNNAEDGTNILALL
eukprot:11932565-Ditylum_brightwellii.AAC.1